MVGIEAMKRAFNGLARGRTTENGRYPDHAIAFRSSWGVALGGSSWGAGDYAWVVSMPGMIVFQGVLYRVASSLEGRCRDPRRA